MKTVRIGIFGALRGAYGFHESIKACGGEIVALCDKNPKRIETALEKYCSTAKVYSSFDEFLEHPMDAVLIANYFHEHAEYAARCLERGLHVLSECTSNGTMADGVRLVRAAEKSDAIYMLLENYPLMTVTREIKRVCDGGTLGKILYAEGEYNHPVNPYSKEDLSHLFDGEKHWRNFLPRTYYLTHSLSPIMYATGATPVRVTAVPIFAPSPSDCNRASNCGDKAAIITTLNDDDSVFKFTANSSFGAKDNSYRVCGEWGQIENIRGLNGKIMLRYNEWNKPEDKECVNFYMPEINDKDKEQIEKAGHGGGDFVAIRTFFECIRENKKPDFDVYFATTMSSVGILAHRSVLEGGKPYDIPNFRLEADRVKWENDRLSPFWSSDGTPPSLPCCSHPDYKPSEQQKENYLRLLAESEANKAKELEK